MEELIHHSTAPLLTDSPWPGGIADVSTFQGNLVTKCIDDHRNKIT